MKWSHNLGWCLLIIAVLVVSLLLAITELAALELAAWRKFLEDVLVRIPGVRETRTYAVLEEVKSTTQLPI